MGEIENKKYGKVAEYRYKCGIMFKSILD